jgi:hypothetical protein
MRLGLSVHGHTRTGVRVEEENVNRNTSILSEIAPLELTYGRRRDERVAKQGK